MAVVTLDKLTKIYDRAHLPAADAVSLDVQHGEFMVLLGPSGCGKTTTLRMIAGLESISAGTLSIDGRVGQSGAGQGSRHRHGVPVLRALPAHDGEGQSGLRPQAPLDRARRDRTPRCRGCRYARAFRVCSIASRMRCRAASASAWRSAVPSSATPRSFCSTSRSPISTPRCVFRRAASSPSCIAGWARP